MRLDGKASVGFFLGYIGTPRMIEQYENRDLDHDRQRDRAGGGGSGFTGSTGGSRHGHRSRLSLCSTSVFRAPRDPPNRTPTLPTGQLRNCWRCAAGLCCEWESSAVLWTQQGGTGSNRLYVARFNGTAWDTTFGVLSGVAGNNGDVQGADVAVDSAGEPTVAWSEEDTTTSTVAVYVWKSNY